MAAAYQRVTAAGRVAFSPVADGRQLPRSPAYTAGRPVTMLFDVESRVEADWRGGERKVLGHLPLRVPRR